MGVNWTDADEEIGSLRAAGFWNPPAATAMEVLGLDEREVPHSRVLRWLLDPTGSHGLGLRMLGALLRRSGREDLAASLLPERIRVQRELVLEGSVEHADRRADIVVWVAGTPVVIEMKVRAKESTDQTRDLAGHFHALHDSPLFIYLTLDGSDADHHAFRPVRLKEVAFDLRETLAAAPAPTRAAEIVGRRTAADYLETLGRLTRMDATSQAAARFWLRHGDDRAFRDAKAAAWTLLRELPDRTAQALAEHCGTAGSDFRTFIRLEEVQGKDTLRDERIVLLAHQRWLDEQDEPRAGVGLAVREHRYHDDDNWTQHNMPFCGIWFSDPTLHQVLVDRPMKSWGKWGVNWDYLPMGLEEAGTRQDPVDVYARRAAALIRDLWTAHSARIDAIVYGTATEPSEGPEETLFCQPG
ncbi:PD-(D/E)XK nuclease family protein [Streptomyces sp. NPDC020490]|uniref:PD-(D/E)XK nuclease family protein n=1 Tax=Streptomyces sp. NPDC020490 TaxID=3365078 RepID=UPI003794B8AD